MLSVARRQAEVGNSRVSADEKIGQRTKPCATSTPMHPKCFGGTARTIPRQGAALGLVHVEQTVQRIDIGAGYQQLGVDHQVDMQGSLLAARLKLLDGPDMPRAAHVHAIDPHIGVDQDTCAAVVARKAIGGHDVGWLEARRRRRARSS